MQLIHTFAGIVALYVLFWLWTVSPSLALGFGLAILYFSKGVEPASVE